MAELTQYRDENPILKPQSVTSRAEGYENLAKTLGNIASQSASKAEDYEEEASHAQLLQSQSMLNDLETNTKIQMLQNPGMSVQIAEKAQYTADSIKQNAYLNSKDRVNFNYLADNTIRDIKFNGVKTSYGLSQEKAKYSILSSFDTIKQQVYEKLFTDPKAADILINSSYKTLEGAVGQGILTASEGAVLHKAIMEEVQRARIRTVQATSGDATAADVNAINSYQSQQSPYSNLDMPMTGSTQAIAGSYLGHMSNADARAMIAAGQPLPATALMYIKSDEAALSIQKYKEGAAVANGKILAGVPWQEIKQEAKNFNTEHLKLSDEQEGYRDRLNNFITSIEKFGGYQSYIASTPDGARAYHDFNMKKAMIDGTTFLGTPEQQTQQKQMESIKNLNQLWSRLNAVGIGIDIPDQYRNPIQEQYTTPIKNAFVNGADPNSAINMIAVFDKNNLPYAANAMPDTRKRLTVYQTGQIIGKADAGFLTSFWKSQQDGIDYKNLQTDKTGMSNDKLKDKVNPILKQNNDYLSRLPHGAELVSASTDMAVRFVKYKALENNDPSFSHINDYITEYKNNMNRSITPLSSFNYMMDTNVIPVQKPQADVLAAYALNQAYKQMRGYMNDEEFKESISRNPPFVISSPTGRITVVDHFGRAIADKNGHAAFDELYTEGLLRHAENDKEAINIAVTGNPFMRRGIRPYEFEMELGENLMRQKLEEGLKK